MKYELIKDSHVGVIVDRMPVFLDIAETFKIAFDLPQEGPYIALFRDESGTEYKAVIRDGAVAVPRGIIGKEQCVGLTVCLVEEEKILWAWECHPFRICAFLHLRRTQWQITSALSDADLLARLAEIERIHAETVAQFSALKRAYEETAAAAAQTLADFEKRLSNAEATNRTLAEAYNRATYVVNDLSQRMTAVEKNYDPTLIK